MVTLIWGRTRYRRVFGLALVSGTIRVYKRRLEMKDDDTYVDPQTVIAKAIERGYARCEYVSKMRMGNVLAIER